MKKIILASASPRRRELMKQAGFEFTVDVSDIDEKTDTRLPDETVQLLSYGKACAVADKYPEDCIVIGADTVVALDDQIMGKPKDQEEAAQMLRLLSGRTHQVYTGVTVIEGPAGRRKAATWSCRTDVTFYELTDEMISRYVLSGDCMDKAGAYGIQGAAAVFVSGICGDDNNVVGLPIASIWQFLNQSKE